MSNAQHRTRRVALMLGALLVTAVVVAAVPKQPSSGTIAAYKDPAKPGLPSAKMTLDLERTALVVIDPQIDFMSPKGKAWSVVGESVTEQRLVPNLIRLFEASKKAGLVVAISPHYYYPHDHKWKFAAPVEMFQHNIKIFDRPGALSLEGSEVREPTSCPNSSLILKTARPLWHRLTSCTGRT